MPTNNSRSGPAGIESASATGMPPRKPLQVSGKESRVATMLILCEDIAEEIVRICEQSFEIEHLIQPATGTLGTGRFFWLRVVPGMTERIQQPVHEVIEIAPTFPTTVASDGIEGSLQHLACGGISVRTPRDLRNPITYDLAGLHQVVPMAPTFPGEIVRGEQVRKHPAV